MVLASSLVCLVFRFLMVSLLYLSPGEQFIDQVALGGLTIPQQSLSSAILADGFDGVDGILG